MHERYGRSPPGGGPKPRGGRRVRFRAHRFAFEATRGPIPPGPFVLHTCDRKSCCRPDHLFLGTKRENSHDMMRKGRWNGRVPPRLGPAQVRAVRARLAAGDGATALGKAFGVRRDLIEDIRRGQAYAWVE